MRTLGGSLFALFAAQGPDDSLPGGVASSGIVQLILERGTPVTWAVLLTLAAFSIASWSIIFYKSLAFRRSERLTMTFLEVFRRSNKFSEVQAVCRSLGESPLVGLFQAGYAELTTQLRQAAGPEASNDPHASLGNAPRPTLRSLGALDRALTRASVAEVNKLERRVSFLATTAGTSPFIGLFGTVWGIMMAFQGIGQTGSTNLGVVAPGIAEALIATAAGLVAAIPAVVFYNHLSNRIKLFASQMDDFAMEFLNIAERNFT